MVSTGNEMSPPVVVEQYDTSVYKIIPVLQYFILNLMYGVLRLGPIRTMPSYLTAFNIVLKQCLDGALS
jgi:hypothetical protein